MGRFKKGAVLGGLLGAGLMWMFTTKKGRQVRGQMLDTTAKLYPEVKKMVVASGGWKKISKSKYTEIVKEVVNKYAVSNGLAVAAKSMIIKLLHQQFKGKK